MCNSIDVMYPEHCIFFACMNKISLHLPHNIEQSIMSANLSKLGLLRQCITELEVELKKKNVKLEERRTHYNDLMKQINELDKQPQGGHGPKRTHSTRGISILSGAGC